MNASHKVKWIWWAPARCATRSISDIMYHYEFKEHPDQNEIVYHPDGYTHKIGIPVGCEDYKIVMQVRNPYSRILSLWHLECFKETDEILTITKPFEEFVIGRVASDYVEAINIRFPDYLIRYENLIKDIVNLPFIDMNDLFIQKEFINNIFSNNYRNAGTYDESGLKRDPNAFQFADWKSYYNENLANIVYTNNKEQFEVFGYAKDSWK
jgi:hypothetical protein